MIDPNSVTNPEIVSFLYAYLPHRNMLRDFYELLPEDQYDFRLVDTPTHCSDSPRESLAHIIKTRLIYLHGVKTGTLTFEPVGVDHLRGAAKSVLLEAWDTFEAEMITLLQSQNLDLSETVQCPWGPMSVLHTLFLIRDHEILHTGWNLALIDVLGLARYSSLKEYWG